MRNRGQHVLIDVDGVLLVVILVVARGVVSVDLKELVLLLGG